MREGRVLALAAAAAAAILSPATALARFSMEDDDAGIPAPPPDAGKIQKGATVVTVGGYGGAAALRGDLDKHAEVVGLHTSSSGPVPHTGVTAAAYIGGATTMYTNHTAASYLAVKGDSGAPVIHTARDGSTRPLGLHTGTMNVYVAPPDDRLFHQGAPSTADSNSEQFSLFSPWENTERDLTLSWP